MPDIDYHPDEESQELARTLASRTVEDLRQGESRREPDMPAVNMEVHARELGVDAPMQDITFVMQEFAWQWDMAREFDGEMPCVRVRDGESTEMVPLSLPFDWPFQGPFRSRWVRRNFLFPPEFLYEAYRDYLHTQSKTEEITTESSDRVLKHVETGLGNFLAYRIAGFRAWVRWMMGTKSGDQRGSLGSKGGPPPQPGGGPPGLGRTPPPPPSSSPGGGLGVEVSCMTHGLTIEFSHCYFIHFLNFGAPSSPVKNTLMAGRYVFRGKGPMYPTGTTHSPIFRIPPDYKPVITYF